jgi:site-specific DNA-methyltransferase (adenine-specific)
MIELYNDDCIKTMKQLINEHRLVDLIVVDPPYKLTTRGNGGGAGGMLQQSIVNKGKVFNDNDIDIVDWLPLLWDLLKDKGHCYIMTNNKNIYHYLNVIENTYFHNDKKQKFHFVKNLIWVKDNKILNQSYMSQFEYIIMLRKGAFKPINDCGCSDVFHIKNKKTKDENKKVIHVTEKPIELMKILVSNSSNEDEWVLDFAMGIGSTGIACKELNRNFIGIELDERYFNVAQNRINLTT